MAKLGKANRLSFNGPRTGSSTEPALKDRTIFYTDLAYMKSQFKGNIWAAQSIYFMKKNAKQFLDPRKAREYRALDDLNIDTAVYRQMFDPKTPMGGGGTADYVAADFKANPIYIHLKNVVKAEIQRTAKELEVNMIDKYAKTRKMNDNYRILYGKALRQIINEYNKSIGKPPLMAGQDPFKYLAAKQKTQATQSDQSQIQPGDTVDDYVTLIRNQITDSQDMAIYNELIYKGDYEIAFEKGIAHYLMNQNKWLDRWSDEFIDDIMHFNKACGEWYTDYTTGRPVVERFVPEVLFTNPFRRKDGEDLQYYLYEYPVTFADFVKEIGASLDSETLKKVFEYNKTQGSRHGLDWIDWSVGDSYSRDNAMIRVGKAAMLTQEYEVDMDAVIVNYPGGMEHQSWTEGANEKPVMPQSKKHYNVWYSWYYLPPTAEHMSNADYAWQAQFIFNIKKNQDQFRTGESGRYCKPPLVIYDNKGQASFTDIVQAWMPKINYAFMQYQNCLVGDIEASILSDEMIGGMLAAIDEDNKVNGANPDRATGGNGSDAYMEQWRMIKQRGTGFLKMTDKQGQATIDPAKLQLIYKNGQLDRAEKFMAQMLNMYSMLTLSLAITDAREGQDVKPRTTVAAIEESLKASNNATWFVQKGYEVFLKMYAERIVRYILEIMKEAKQYGYTERRDEFFQVVGVANGLMVEGMEDVEPEDVGMTVNYVDNSTKKDFVMQLAVERSKNGLLDDDFLYLLMGTDNWKYSFALMRMGINHRKKEIAAKEELDFERQKELQDGQFKIAQALQGQKIQGNLTQEQIAGQIDQALQDALIRGKTASQSVLKDQTTQSRKEEMDHAAQLEAEKPIEKVLATAT